ncbi:uncharacterized protein DUF4239 [Solirubrobacter pauli]|uniref:Uncharacterized protein DUF4239 n=1 Tax=Solirubrobacter pauli TaxID=166793 RepID=A0A660L107_9ACTN|nr:DUF4239 domain-containing protein [Solirubrobacter pauli]RKQ84960.1 uncharacterized protein DUF4239 [Solirubrobacter pauli]
MTRWLLNTFPTWALVPLVIGPFLLFAVAGFALVGHRARGPHTGGEAAGVLIGVVGAVYGIVLAFVVVVLYQDYQDAGATVRAEATEIEQVTRHFGAFDAAAQADVARRLDAYTRVVVASEWEQMRDGRLSPQAWREIDGLYAAVQRHPPRSDVQGVFYEETIATLDALVATRRERLRFAEERLPAALQVLIFGGAFVLIGFTLLVEAASTPLQRAMVVVVAGLIGLNLLLVVLLDHPFSGELSVSSHALVERATER